MVSFRFQVSFSLDNYAAIGGGIVALTKYQ